MSGAYGNKLHISTLYVMPSTATSREEIHRQIYYITDLRSSHGRSPETRVRHLFIEMQSIDWQALHKVNPHDVNFHNY